MANASGGNLRSRNRDDPNWYVGSLADNVSARQPDEVMDIRKDKVGLIIGKKGWRLQDINEKSGARVDVKDDKVHLRGTPEQREKAKKHIKEILNPRQLFPLRHQQKEVGGRRSEVGAHIKSFVRSVTMDKWKDIELEKMKVGGNSKAKAFFKSQPDFRSNMTIQEKYNTRAAALYRDKISSLAEGKSWSEETSPARNYETGMTRSTGGDAGGSHLSNGSKSMSHCSSPEMMLGISKQELNSQKEEFFNRRQKENAARPDNLPPSQGGRYVGFGSAPAPAQTTTNNSECQLNLYSTCSHFDGQCRAANNGRSTDNVWSKIGFVRSNP